MSRSFPPPDTAAIARTDRAKHTAAEQAERAAAEVETAHILAGVLSRPNARLMTCVLLDHAFHAFRAAHGELPAHARYASLRGQAERIATAPARTAAEAVFKSGERAA